MSIDPATLKANWNYPTTIRFGPGRIAEIAAACRYAGIARPQIVTDPGLAGLPMIADAQARLAEAGMPAAVFADVQGNPVGANVEAGVAAFKAGGHDGVIAWGGGSALDAGKAVALMAGQTRSMWDFEDVGDNWKRVDADRVAPVVAVPTTAGTGSETGRASVITNVGADRKIVVFHPAMMPKCVVADPELTVGLPPHLTAATGMDAFAHCLEAYCAPGFHPMADGIAVEGVRLVKDWLPAAVRDGKDMAARAHMMVAASMGSTAFQKGLGAIHSLSHPCGSLFHTHHGLTNAVVMPYVLAYNRPVIEQRIGRLARYLGLDGSFDGFMRWVLDLRAEIAIPNTLAALKVDPAAVDRMAELAAIDPCAGGNPRHVGVAEHIHLYHAALNGDLKSAGWHA
ncbi:MAG: iron-containing alcohol dehydrogenase [Alphaproteobacteria bacterium]